MKLHQPYKFSLLGKAEPMLAFLFCGLPKFGGETEKCRELFDGNEGMGQGFQEAPESNDSLTAFLHHLFEVYGLPSSYATLFFTNPLLYLKGITFSSQPWAHFLTSF